MMDKIEQLMELADLYAEALYFEPEPDPDLGREETAEEAEAISAPREEARKNLEAAIRSAIADERERIARFIESQHGDRSQREHAAKLAAQVRLA